MEKFSYENTVTDAYSGQINCAAYIYVNKELVGGVDYVLYDGELTVSNIIVKPEWRRQGIGSRLMKYIKEINPEFKYIPSWKTEEGSLFIHKDLSLTEKLVSESLSDILKPKSEKEIKKTLFNYLNTKYDLDYLNTEINKLPTIETYLKSFYYERHLYKDDAYKFKHKFSENKRYETIDLTNEAKEIILQNVSKITTNSTLKAYQNIPTTTNLSKFLYEFNKLYKCKHYKNDVFDYINATDGYAFFGTTHGFSLFIIPNNFIQTLI